MNYLDVRDYIAYQCRNTDEVSQLIKEISANINLSSCANMQYQHFTDFAAIYATICEYLEIYPQQPTIHYEGKIYEGQLVYSNLKYAKQLFTEYLIDFIQKRENDSL